MTAKDFILGSTYELQEKNKDKKFWDETELFIKLQRAYKEIQKDLPCFIEDEEIAIKEGIRVYNLKFEAIRHISFMINHHPYSFHEKEYIYKNLDHSKIYNLETKQLLISPTPKKCNIGILAYYYIKELLNDNDFITVPYEYEEPLRLLFLSFVFEKAPKDMNQRDLSIHYLNRYKLSIAELKKQRIKKSVVNKYQRI